MILSEWDEKKLPSRLQETGWGFPEDYDVFRLKTNPDPDSGYEHTMSSIYCLKERKLPCSSTP